jgi:hypothetical protein
VAGPSDASLAQAAEFQTLVEAGSGPIIAARFTRPASSFAPTYAELQAGKIHQSTDPAGRMLSLLFDFIAPPKQGAEKHPGHKLPFDKLPAYDTLRGHLTPARMEARQIEQGWQLTGFAK